MCCVRGQEAKHSHTKTTHPPLSTPQVRLPLADLETDGRAYDDDKGEVGGFGAAGGRVAVTQCIPHDGEVNRARAMPHNPFLVATKTVSSEVYVFDYTKHPSKPEGGKCNPDLRLAGHKAEGYGLAWSPHTEGRLLSGSDDAQICIWDVAAAPRGARTLDATSVFREHLGVVEDVAWHGRQPHVFGSVGDDKALILWDARNPRGVTSRTDAHGAEVNCLHFNPFNEFVLATGSADRTVSGGGRVG